MLLTKEEIIAEEAIPAGTLRHTIHHDEGDEGVALNNLLAILSHHCTDFTGNKFGAYIVVPLTFWQKIRRDWQDTQGKDPDLLPKNVHGGYMGLFPYVTIYPAEIDYILLKPDIGTLTYMFTIGDVHLLTWNKDKLVEAYGWEAVGYDNRLPYVPWWDDHYAPPQLLLEWVKEDGYLPAFKLLEAPPQDAIDQWIRQGLISAPQDLPKLEAPKVPIDYEEGSFEEYEADSEDWVNK